MIPITNNYNDHLELSSTRIIHNLAVLAKDAADLTFMPTILSRAYYYWNL